MRVVSLGDFSRELCGGTHLRASGEIGIFKITGESSISSGIRRIEALAGEAAVRHLEKDLAVFHQVLGHFGQKADGLLAFLQNLEARARENEKQVKKAPPARPVDIEDVIKDAQQINGVPAVIAALPGADRDALSLMADEIKNRIRGIAILYANNEERSHVVASVFKDLTGKFNANILIKKIAPMINGKGGGRSDFAQAGGEPIADTSGFREKIAGALREGNES